MMKTNIQRKGELFVFLGALFWSLNAPLIKFISLDAMLVCGLRSLIAGVALLPFLFRSKLRFSKGMLVYLIAYASLCLSIVLALRQTSAVAIGMQYGSVVWLFLAASILNKSVNKSRILPVVLTTTGVIIFMLSGIAGSNMKGNLIALTESIFFAVMTVAAKKVSSGEAGNALGLVSLANLFTGICIFAFFPPQFADILTLNGSEWMLMLILGIVQVALGYAMYNLGVNLISPQKASVIAMWEMILGPVGTALFLKEYPSTMVIIGFVIIIAGIFLDTKAAPDAAAGDGRL